MYHSLVRLLMVVIATLGAMVLIADDQGPSIPRGTGDQCVADTNVMRRDHMDLMVHQRDDTVIKGIRGNPYSIVGCVECHAQKDNDGNAIRVDAEGQFCQSCHAYAAVKIDCFGCHAAVPDQNPHRAGLQQPAHARPWSDFMIAQH